MTGPYLFTHAPKVLTYIPKEMDVYCGTVQSAVVHTNETPLSKNLHLEPRFPDGGWDLSRFGVGPPLSNRDTSICSIMEVGLGWEVSFPLPMAIPPPPPFGRGFDVRSRAWRRRAWQRWAWQRL